MDPASDVNILRTGPPHRIQVRLLVLLWKLGSSQKPGCITKEEFVSGMKRFGSVHQSFSLLLLIPQRHEPGRDSSKNPKP
jgi:hypothetical protein